MYGAWVLCLPQVRTTGGPLGNCSLRLCSEESPPGCLQPMLIVPGSLRIPVASRAESIVISPPMYKPFLAGYLGSLALNYTPYHNC